MYEILGWLNVSLLVVMTSPYWLRFLNKQFFHWKGGLYAKTIKVLRTVHKPVGLTILLIALVHGYLALGAFRLHTGSLLWLSILLTAIAGATFFLSKKKPAFVWHKRLVLIVLVMLFLHLVFPSAVYYLFR